MISNIFTGLSGLDKKIYFEKLSFKRRIYLLIKNNSTVKTIEKCLDSDYYL